MTRSKTATAKAEQPALFPGGDDRGPAAVAGALAAAKLHEKPAPKAKTAKPATEKPTTAVAVIRRDQDSLLAIAARAAENPKIDAAKMREIFEMQKEVRADQARAFFNESFLAMQDELPHIGADKKIVIPAKDGKRGQSTPYASYKNILTIVKPILQRHGFSIWQSTEPTPDGTRLIVKTALEHVGGHRRETAFPLPAEVSGSKNNVQGWGSAQSYGRRYGVLALLNLITGDPADDDGNGVAPRAAKVIDGEATEIVDDGVAKITTKQHDELVDAIESCGATRKQFCNAWKIDAVADLPAEHFTRAMKACADKGKR